MYSSILLRRPVVSLLRGHLGVLCPTTRETEPNEGARGGLTDVAGENIKPKERTKEMDSRGSRERSE